MTKPEKLEGFGGWLIIFQIWLWWLLIGFGLSGTSIGVARLIEHIIFMCFFYLGKRFMPVVTIIYLWYISYSSLEFYNSNIYFILIGTIFSLGATFYF